MTFGISASHRGNARGRRFRHIRLKELAMGRLIRASLIAGACLALAAPAFAQITDQACMLRCLDHGHLDQYCQSVCTKGVPPAAPLSPSRSSEPAQQAAPLSAPALPAASSTPPLATQPATPAKSQPANAPPFSPSAVQPAPQPAQNQAPPQPAQPVQNKAPPQPAAQTAPQQVAKPYVPPRPVNQACVLRCLDHGHLDQYCLAVCAH